MGTNSDIELSKVIKGLLPGEKLPDDLIQHYIAAINWILRNEDSEMDWDDAWDTIDLLNFQHHNALPYLCEMMCEEGRCISHDRDARIWAMRAVAKIDQNIAEVVPCLLELLRHKDRELRHEAATTLRKCGYKHLLKRF